MIGGTAEEETSNFVGAERARRAQQPIKFRTCRSTSCRLIGSAPEIGRMNIKA